MTTDTTLLEAFLQNTSRDLGLKITFNQVSDSQLNIIHHEFGAEKSQYLKFDSKLVAVANNAVHFSDARNFSNVGSKEFNPNQYINFNITSIGKINDKIRARMAPQMPEQVFIDLLEKPKEPEA